MDIIARRIPTAVRSPIVTDNAAEVEIVIGTSHFMITDSNQEGIRIKKLNGDMNISILADKEIMVK